MSAVVPNPKRNAITGALTFLAFVVMVGMAYASVPLYRLFCQKTGFGGTPVRADVASRVVLGQTMTIRFDGNTDTALPWRFSPVLAQQTVKIGANSMAFFEAINDSDKPVTGRATFNVSPDIASPYFTKVQCFCFTEQTLQPGEKVMMPVSYYIDPKIIGDAQARRVPEITLSYTFYRAENPEQTAAVDQTSTTALR